MFKNNRVEVEWLSLVEKDPSCLLSDATIASPQNPCTMQEIISNIDTVSLVFSRLTFGAKKTKKLMYYAHCLATQSCRSKDVEYNKAGQRLYLAMANDMRFAEDPDVFTAAVNGILAIFTAKAFSPEILSAAKESLAKLAHVKNKGALAYLDRTNIDPTLRLGHLIDLTDAIKKQTGRVSDADFNHVVRQATHLNALLGKSVALWRHPTDEELQNAARSVDAVAIERKILFQAQKAFVVIAERDATRKESITKVVDHLLCRFAGNFALRDDSLCCALCETLAKMQSRPKIYARANRINKEPS